MADVIEVEVFNKLFASIAEEMDTSPAKSAFSPNLTRLIHEEVKVNLFGKYFRFHHYS